MNNPKSRSNKIVVVAMIVFGFAEILLAFKAEITGLSGISFPEFVLFLFLANFSLNSLQGINKHRLQTAAYKSSDPITLTLLSESSILLEKAASLTH